MRTIVAIATALCVPFFMSGAAADSHEEPGALASVWIVVAKDGHAEQFEAAFKEHIKYRKKKKDPRNWDTYQPAVGKHLDYYHIRYCCFDWADEDAYGAWNETAKTGDHWNENVDPHVASYQHYLEEIDHENNNWPEGTDSTLVGVTRWVPKAGHGAAISKSRSELSSMAKEHGWPRKWAWGERIGGGSQVFLASPQPNYAGFAPPEQNFMEFLAEHTGSEETAAEMLKNFSQNFEKSYYTIYRHNKEMSMTD